MKPEKVVLCASSKYEQKFYLNELFTEDVGGILRLEFDQEGSLNLVTEAFDEDLLYDEIGCELKIKQLQKDKQQLFSSLELFYKVFYLEDY